MSSQTTNILTVAEQATLEGIALATHLEKIADQIAGLLDGGQMHSMSAPVQRLSESLSIAFDARPVGAHESKFDSNVHKAAEALRKARMQLNLAAGHLTQAGMEKRRQTPGTPEHEFAQGTKPNAISKAPSCYTETEPMAKVDPVPATARSTAPAVKGVVYLDTNNGILYCSTKCAREDGFRGTLSKVEAAAVADENDDRFWYDTDDGCRPGVGMTEDFRVEGVTTLDRAAPGLLSFVTSEKFRDEAKDSEASACRTWGSRCS